MGVEAVLRGALAAIALFLTGTGLITLLFGEAPVAIQLVQLAHMRIGLLLILLGALYLVVHLVQVFGGLRAPLARAPRTPLIAFAVLVLLTWIATYPLAYRTRLLVHGVQAAAALTMTVSLALALRRAARRRRNPPAFTGGAFLLAAVILVASGAGVAFGTKSRTGVYDSAWFAHVLAVLPAVVLAVVHVRSSRRRPIEAQEPRGRGYAWRRPLLVVAAPLLALLVAGTTIRATGAGTRLEPLEVDARAIVATDVGAFERIPSTCAMCHFDVIDTWASSSHSVAADNPLFTAMLRDLVRREGGEAARFCLGCHAPHAPDPALNDIEAVVASDGYAAGVHCVSCHRAWPGPGHGDGSLVGAPLAEERTVLAFERSGAHAAELARDPAVQNSLVFSRLERHFETYRLATDGVEICLPCHVQTLAAPTDGRVDEVLQDHYDDWLESPAARAGRDCNDCHMPKFISPRGYGVADHRFLGGSTYAVGVAGGRPVDVVAHLEEAMPLAPGWLETAGQLPGSGPLLAMDARLEGSVDGRPELVVRTRNAGRLGHSFPNGPTDLFEVWLELEAVDARGRTLLDLGRDGVAGAPRLGHRLRDARGRVITDHRLSDVAEIEDLGRVPAEGTHELRLALPEAPALPLAVRGGWRYRRLSPELLERMTGEALELPVARVGELDVSLPAADGAG